VIVRLERSFVARPHEVYRAWLDPEPVSRWMAPGDLRVTRVEIDERVGGRYRIWQADRSGPAGGFDCELVALVPDRRIVFRWGFVGPDRASGPAYDSLLTVTLHEAAGGGTTLTLVHERLDDLAQAMPDVAENVGPGWELALDKLGTTVGGD
jgi:uncharacterized protein YndB with AHSA1/START domain